MVGFEALVRWNHSLRGLISPVDFIPLAGRNRADRSARRMGAAQACIDAASWPQDVGVAVNLSPVQFENPNLVSTVKEALAGLRPSGATGSNSRSPNRCCCRTARRRWRCCTSCAASASGSRSTISAPAIRR